MNGGFAGQSITLPGIHFASCVTVSFSTIRGALKCGFDLSKMKSSLLISFNVAICNFYCCFLVFSVDCWVILRRFLFNKIR
jgi:hypothetical protein